MQVKIGDVWYDSAEVPIMIKFDDESLEHVRNMGDLTRYASVPEGSFEDEQHFSDWMSDLRRVKELSPDAIEKLDQRMREANMITYSTMMRTVADNKFIGHAQVRSLEQFVQWLEMRYGESVSLQAQLQMEGKEDDELFEWTIAHVAIFKEVITNFKQTQR